MQQQEGRHDCGWHHVQPAVTCEAAFDLATADAAWCNDPLTPICRYCSQRHVYGLSCEDAALRRANFEHLRELVRSARAAFADAAATGEKRWVARDHMMRQLGEDKDTDLVQ